jgi:hypothetical protein
MSRESATDPWSGSPLPHDEIVLLRVAADISEGKHNDGKARRGGLGGRRVRCASRRSGLDLNGIDTHGPRDVLERLFSEVDEFRIDSAAHVLMRRARNGYTTGFGDAFEPRGDVDALAKDIFAFNKHIAKVDADPVEDAFRFEGGVIAGRRLLLHRQGALDRRDHRREFDKHPVAHDLE